MIIGFLVEFSRLTGDARVTRFTGPSGPHDALMRRIELEEQRIDGEWEIVALNSRSFESVSVTHSRYFQGHVTMLDSQDAPIAR